MSQLTPELDAALAQPTVFLFGAIRIELPDYRLCLLDGAGAVAFGGDTYVGRDDVFGVLDSVDDLADGVGDDSAPKIEIGLIPASDAAAATLSAAAMQGSPVYIEMGAIDPASGLAVPDPNLLFAGELDVPKLVSTKAGRRLSYEVASIFERLFTDDEGVRLSPSWHKSVWPDETGVDEVTGIEDAAYWGVDPPKGAVTYGGGGGGYGGIYGGGGGLYQREADL
jgi:hypothetical protein